MNDTINPTEYTGLGVHPLESQVAVMRGVFTRLFDLKNLIRVRDALGQCRDVLLLDDLTGEYGTDFGLCYLLTSRMADVEVEGRVEGYDIVQAWAKHFAEERGYPFEQYDTDGLEVPFDWPRCPLRTEHGRKPRLALLSVLIQAADEAIHAEVCWEARHA